MQGQATRTSRRHGTPDVTRLACILVDLPPRSGQSAVPGPRRRPPTQAVSVCRVSSCPPAAFSRTPMTLAMRMPGCDVACKDRDGIHADQGQVPHFPAGHAQFRGTCRDSCAYAVYQSEGAGRGSGRGRLMRQAGLAGRHRRRRHRTTTPACTPPPALTWQFTTSSPALPPSAPADAATSRTSPQTRAGSARRASSASLRSTLPTGPLAAIIANRTGRRRPTAAGRSGLDQVLSRSDGQELRPSGRPVRPGNAARSQELSCLQSGTVPLQPLSTAP